MGDGLPGRGGGIRTSASRNQILLNFIPPQRDLGVDWALPEDDIQLLLHRRPTEKISKPELPQRDVPKSSLDFKLRRGCLRRASIQSKFEFAKS